jgi:AcrR family transcriptional regulator
VVEAKTESGRQRILEQAQRLFLARNYSGVSIRDIAQACGFSNAALYYHFGNKENLYFEMLKAYIAQLTQRLLKAAEVKGTCRERLTHVVSLYAQIALESQGEIQVVLRDLAQFSFQKVQQAIPELKQQDTSAISIVLEEGIARGEVRPVDVRRVDNLLLGMIHSLVTRRVTQGENQTSLADDVVLIIGILFDGIGTSQPVTDTPGGRSS